MNYLQIKRCHTIFTFYFLLQSSLKYSVRSNHNQVHWSPSFSFHPKYGQCFFLQNPFISLPIPNPILEKSKDVSVLLALGRIVFPLAGVPEKQRDADGG